MTFMLVFAGVLSIGAQNAGADDVITWKAPCHWPAASVSFKDSLKAVADIVKEKSNGRFIIEPQPAGSVIPGPQTLSAVKRGMFPIGVTSSAYDLQEIPILNVVAGLPLNFAEVWEGVYFHQWLGFEKMVRDIFREEHGMLFFTDKIYTTELSLKKPVRSFDDFKGLKLRSSGIMQRYLTSIGAAAQMIPGGDVYAALASGMMEGAHWGAVQGSSSMKFYEINKYHLRPPLNVAATDIWLVNKKAFDKLPKDLQDILVTTLEEHFWRRTNQYQYAFICAGFGLHRCALLFSASFGSAHTAGGAGRLDASFSYSKGSSSSDDDCCHGAWLHCLWNCNTHGSRGRRSAGGSYLRTRLPAA